MTGGITNRSVTITLGGTAQTAAAANKGRRYLLIQNVDLTEAAWVRLDGEAAAAGAAGSILLPAGGSSFVAESSHCPTALVSVVAATTGHAITIYEG